MILSHLKDGIVAIICRKNPQVPFYAPKGKSLRVKPSLCFLFSAIVMATDLRKRREDQINQDAKVRKSTCCIGKYWSPF
jgi:hypothetical protein